MPTTTEIYKGKIDFTNNRIDKVNGMEPQDIPQATKKGTSPTTLKAAREVYADEHKALTEALYPLLSELSEEFEKKKDNGKFKKIIAKYCEGRLNNKNNYVDKNNVNTDTDVDNTDLNV